MPNLKHEEIVKDDLDSLGERPPVRHRYLGRRTEADPDAGPAPPSATRSTGGAELASRRLCIGSYSKTLLRSLPISKDSSAFW